MRTRSGWRAQAPANELGSSPDELLASSDVGTAAASSAANSSRLAPARSGPFSRTRSAAAAASPRSAVKTRRSGRAAARRARVELAAPRSPRSRRRRRPPGRGDHLAARGQRQRHPARPDRAGADDRDRADSAALITGGLPSARARASSVNGSSEVGYRAGRRGWPRPPGGPCRIRLTGSSSFLPVRFRGIAGTAVDPVRDVPGRQRRAQRGRDRLRSCSSSRPPGSARRTAAARRCRRAGPPGARPGCRRSRRVPRRRR